MLPSVIVGDIAGILNGVAFLTIAVRENFFPVHVREEQRYQNRTTGLL
jgi:hypothetical protein